MNEKIKEDIKDVEFQTKIIFQQNYINVFTSFIVYFHSFYIIYKLITT